jgi:hypothetical protein
MGGDKRIIIKGRLDSFRALENFEALEGKTHPEQEDIRHH